MVFLVKSPSITAPPPAADRWPFARTRCSSRGAPATGPGPPRGSGACRLPVEFGEKSPVDVEKVELPIRKKAVKFLGGKTFSGCFFSVSCLPIWEGDHVLQTCPDHQLGEVAKTSSKPWGEKTNSAQRQRQEIFCSLGEMFQVWHSRRLVYEQEESSETASPLSVWTLKHNGCCLTCASDPTRELAQQMKRVHNAKELPLPLTAMPMRHGERKFQEYFSLLSESPWFPCRKKTRIQSVHTLRDGQSRSLLDVPDRPLQFGKNPLLNRRKVI